MVSLFCELPQSLLSHAAHIGRLSVCSMFTRVGNWYLSLQGETFRGETQQGGARATGHIFCAAHVTNVHYTWSGTLGNDVHTLAFAPWF